MACKKYVLTNNTVKNQTFSYQECSNNMWAYDVLLEPGQTKNIWLVNGTFQSYYTNDMTIVDDGVFPPVASPTPSPSSTPTNTPTPSVTTTPTPSVTTTPTVTPSVTPSGTSSVTPTPTITPSQTPSFNFVVSNINTGGAYVQGVTGTTGTVTTKSGYSYPVDNGDFLYADFTTSGGNLEFDIEVKDPSLSDFQVRVNINGSTSQIATPGPGDITLSLGPYLVLTSELVEVILENA